MCVTLGLVRNTSQAANKSPPLAEKDLQKVFQQMVQASGDKCSLALVTAPPLASRVVPTSLSLTTAERCTLWDGTSLSKLLWRRSFAKRFEQT